MPTSPDDPAWPSKARAMLSELRSDVQSDVDKLDRRPFDGRNVAEVFGELYATVDAVAGTLDGLIARQQMAETAAKHVARAADLGVSAPTPTV